MFKVQTNNESNIFESHVADQLVSLQSSEGERGPSSTRDRSDGLHAAQWERYFHVCPHLLSEWWKCSKITSYLEIMNIFYCCFHLTAQPAGESPANPKKWIKYLYFIFYKRSTSILWRKTVLNRQNVSPLDRSWLIADKCLIVHRRYCKSLTFIYWTEHILVEFWLEIIGIYTTSFHEY